MADFSALKTSIQNYIKQNGNEEITGNLLQQVLLSMVTTLGDSAINDLVTALNNEVSARQNADGTLEGNINTLQEVVNGIKANIDNGYVYAGIANPSTTPASGKVFYLALTAGTYTNFGATVVPQGINILKYNGSAWSLDSFLGLDNAPTQGSNNLVKSGGVLDSIIKDGSAFDLSAYNSGTTYADLSAALTALNALPAAYKKGGMSMKFVQSSDNKYIQARCMAQDFTTDVTQWQGVDDEPIAGSENLVKSGGVNAAIYSKTGKTTTLQLTWTTGKRVYLQEATNPAKIANATNEYAISNYIDITNFANAIYEFGGLHGLTNVESPSINFYDENKNHIGYLYEDGDYSLEKSNIPSGAKYILICQYKVSEYPTSNVSVKEVISSTIIIPTKQIIEGDETQEEINAKLESLVGKIVEPKLSWTNSKRVDTTDSSDSKIIDAGNFFSVSNYIEIIDGTVATVYGVQGYEGVYSYPINFYDADKKWIGCSGDVKGEYCFNSIIPEGAVYVVLCQYITEDYPINRVKIVFEVVGELATKEELEEKVELAKELKAEITQDDIDPISDSSYIVKNGNIVSSSALSAIGSSFMLFKPDITAIEFTIGDLWDNNRFELCLGCGYYNEERVHAGAVVIAAADNNILYTVPVDNPDAGTYIAGDSRELPAGNVSQGSRCMVEIVLNKYILAWVWNATTEKWDYWFMLNPTDTNSLCNPVHTRLRYGWNQRIGIGLSVVYASASAGLEMMKDVKILSRKGTNLEIYHNAVRMGRKFSNKKWLAIGDSITWYDSLNGWGYVGYVSRRNMFDTINCGNSGWGVCEVLQKHAGFAPYDEISIDWETAVTELNPNDIVSIFLGTNDFYAAGRTDIDTVEPYRYPITLGMTDPTDVDAKNPRTILGALRLLIERLLAANPSVKIIVFAPFLRTDSNDVYPVNSEGMTMREFSNAICAVAEEYYLEHYNMCDYAGINTQSIAVLTNDNLHPNQKGGERLGEIMARWIN